MGPETLLEPARAESAIEGPRSREGAGGQIGYLAKMFPRISETFILREILALKRNGIPVRIYSLLPPIRDARAHPEAMALMPEVDYLPSPGWAARGEFLRALGAGFAARPWLTSWEILRVLAAPNRRRLRRLFRALILAERLRRDGVAHLHAAWAHTPASVAWIAARLTGIPWSMGGHAKDLYLSRASSLAKKVSAARFTTVCTRAGHEYLRSLVAAQKDLPRPEIQLHHHGVDTEYFTPAPPIGVESSQAGAAPMILSAGRLVPKKGFDILLEAAGILRDRGLAFRLEIVGAGPLRDALKAQIRALALEDRVVLKGMLVMEEMREAYRRATCMVLASRVGADGDRDGIPNTLAEAMACGLPVIASKMPSIAELITEGETGVLVPPEDPKALAESLAALLGDPGRMARLSQAGLRRVRENFSAEVWGDAIASRFATLQGVERILYLSADRGVPVRGFKGASVHVRSMVKAFRRLGAEVLILSARRGPKDGPAPMAPLVERSSSERSKRFASRIAGILRGGAPLEKAWLRLLDNFGLYREGLRLAMAWHPDILYERYALTAFAGSLLARRLSLPLILEVNAPLAEEEARFRGLRLGWLARRLERAILRRADRVVVVSEALADHARRLGVPPERILVLPNAIDPELFHPRREGRELRERYGLNGSLVLGFSGTLKPWHGVQHLLAAMARLRDTGLQAELLLIGDGPERENLAEQAQGLGLAARVHFAGAVAHEEMGAFLAACDVLVAPYGPMEDHWFSPLKVAEYRAMGVPVIASAIGQMADSLGEAQGVLLVPPGDEKSLAEAIAALASDEDRRRACGRAAAASSSWTWQALAARVLAEAETARREVWRWETA